METSPRRPQIAVLDDDQSVLSALRRLLCARGYDVRTFDSGPALLQAMGSMRPDCLLLDVHLPGMTGFEVLAQARVLDAGLPAIIITAFDDDATRQTARLARVSAFFRKPFDNHALLQTIAECVARVSESA